MTHRAWAILILVASAVLQGIAALAAWAIASTAVMAQRQEPGVPPGWTVYVVHASWCAPCQRFRRDYDTIQQFRGPLESAFAVKSCEWDQPNEQRWARRFGASSLPSFIVFRNGQHYTTFSGYDGNWRGFLERLNIDIETPKYPAGNRAGEDSGLTEQEPRRPVTPQERALPEIADLRSELSRLRQQLADMATNRANPPAAPSAVGPAVISPPPQGNTIDIPPRVRDASASGSDAPARSDTTEPTSSSGFVGPGGAAPGLGGSWGAVAKTLGTAALAVLAPQVVLPTGALGAAITVAQILRRRRQAMQPQQPPRPWTVERPIPVAVPSPPPQPAQVVTTNQYVPIDTDTHANAYTWATAQLVKQYPGAEGTVAMLGSLIEQHKAAQGGKNGHK